MPRAVELLQQGRNEELWQMCCGFLDLNLTQFMQIQKSLLVEQLALLNRSPLGRKLMAGARVETVAEFREKVPLTTYLDYYPELADKREDVLPGKPVMWVHTSGRSGEYPCKWVPITAAYRRELSAIMYGIGMLSSCRWRGDCSGLNKRPRIVYTVAPRPYMSGAMASMLQEQSPSRYLPPLDAAEGMPFEERIKLGFDQALSEGLDYFFGLSLVLVAVGNRFSQSSANLPIRQFLTRPRALFRLARGVVRSRLAGRSMLPRDVWTVKGIMCGGLDSAVYREKIKNLWGRYPLDTYACTEGAIIATQTWDYDAMTFIPNLNFLEFIPESEILKSQQESGYQPRTLLLDELIPGQNYEIVVTNFHGGAMVRYRVGDMVHITARRNDKLGINIPQMVFERRADGLLDFVVIRLSEKQIWQAVEKAGVDYEDWTAYKRPGEATLRLFIEPKNGQRVREADVARAIHEHIMKSDTDAYSTSGVHDDLADMVDFRVEVSLLPHGAFAGYMAQRQSEGADLAHLKPPHINPSERVLALLKARPEAVPAAVKAGPEAEVTRIS